MKQSRFFNKLRSESQLRQKEAVKESKRKLNKSRRRINELDGIIKKLYESYAIGKITEERFDSLLAEYEAEQKELTAFVSEAEQQLSDYEEDSARAEQFLALAKKYTDFSELTTPMINEFVDKIIVHAPEKVDGDRVQEVEIYLNFIGMKRHRIVSRERYQLMKAGKHKVGQPFTLKCKCCGNSFESKMSNTLFCTPKCRAKYYRRQESEKRKREIVCNYCGKSFVATRSDVKYCCKECKEEANRIMRKERYEMKKQQKLNQNTSETVFSEEKKTA